MAIRGSTLSKLTTRVRDVLPGKSTTGGNNDSAVTKALNRARGYMYSQYLWPHLRVKTELTLVGGKAALPTDFYSQASMRDVNNTDWIKQDPMTFEVNQNPGNTWTIEEESAISRTISTAAIVSNIATITTTADHLYQVGDSITQSGVVSTTFNATVVIASVPTATTYTYAIVSGDESSTGGTAVRDAADKIFVKPTGTTQLFLRYYKTLTDLSESTDRSEFFPHQEQAMVWGAIEFLAARDRDLNTIRIWEEKFKKRLDPVYQTALDDDQEGQSLGTEFDKTGVFRGRDFRRIST